MIAAVLITLALLIPLCFALWIFFLWRKNDRAAFWSCFGGCVSVILLISAIQVFAGMTRAYQLHSGFPGMSPQEVEDEKQVQQLIEEYRQLSPDQRAGQLPLNELIKLRRVELMRERKQQAQAPKK